MKKYIVLVMIILGAFSLQAKEEVISELFDTQNIDAVKITSKFGRVKVENWAKNEIAVTATIKVSSNKEEAAEKILSNVSVDMARKGNYINVETTFEMFFSFMKFTNNLFRNGDFSIDYEVKMPQNIILDITLDNGDIVLYERNANVKISHSNGSISSQSIRGTAKLKLRSSKLKINNVDSLFMDAKNSDIFLTKSHYVNAKSYNTSYEIDEVKLLETNSLRDTFSVGDVSDIAATSSLSSFTFGVLKNSAVMDTSYGNVSAEHLGVKFDEVKLTCKGTDVSIGLGATPASIAINHHVSTKLDIPDDFGLNMKFGKDQKYFITTGTVGAVKNNNELLVNIKGGSLQLR